MRKLKNIDLDNLIEKGVIDEETANAIWQFKEKEAENAPNRLGIVLSVIGASLVGLGIMLIVAHNWDNLSRQAKTVLAFLPMIIGQMACIYAFIKQKNSAAWREGAATFLFFAVGACMGMISQIYNLEGELGSFLFTWMLLVLPLIYVMPSSIVSFLYLGGITWYATNCGYTQNHEPYLYWILLAAALPHYYQLYKNRPNGNAFNYHSWAIALSVLVTLGTWAATAKVLMWIAYVSLLGLYFLIGSQAFYRNKKSINNPFLLIGMLGTIAMFLGFTFFAFWEEIVLEKMDWTNIWTKQEFWVTLLLTASSLYLLIKLKPLENISKISPIPFGFLLFFIVFLFGYNSPFIGMILSNLFVLATAIFFIHRGNQKDGSG